MIKRLVLFFICLILLTMLVFVYKPAWISNPVFEVEPEPVPRDIMIVGLGDSLTKGVGDSTKNGYIGYVRNQLDDRETVDEATLYNYGIRGQETEDLLKVLQSQEILNRIEKADYIMMTIGGNDLMEVVEENFFNLTIDLFGEKQQAYQENLNKILSIIRDHNADAQLIYLGVFNPFSKYFSQIEEINKIVVSWNDASREVVSQYENTVFVPTYDLFINKSSDLFSEDHFHPNRKGYVLMGDRVLKNVE